MKSSSSFFGGFVRSWKHTHHELANVRFLVVRRCFAKWHTMREVGQYTVWLFLVYGWNRPSYVTFDNTRDDDLNAHVVNQWRQTTIQKIGKSRTTRPIESYTRRKYATKRYKQYKVTVVDKLNANHKAIGCCCMCVCDAIRLEMSKTNCLTGTFSPTLVVSLLRGLWRSSSIMRKRVGDEKLYGVP